MVQVIGSEDGKTLVSLALGNNDVLVEGSAEEPSLIRDHPEQGSFPNTTEALNGKGTSATAVPAARSQDAPQEVVEQSLEENGEAKSREWYVPGAKGEAKEPQSDFLLTRPLPTETSAKQMQRGLSGSNVQELTGVLMSFRKTKDPIGKSPDMESPTPARECTVSGEEGLSTTSPPAHSTSGNGAGGQSVENPNVTSGLASLLPTTPGRISHSVIPSLCKTDLRNAPKMETKELLTSPLKASGNLSESNTQNNGEIKLEPMKEENGVKAASTGELKKEPQALQTVHGKRFLDCIEEVEEFSDDTFTEVKINPYPAYLVHIEETPFSLWIQKEEDNDLAEYIETWYKEHNQERVDAIKVGDICVTVLGDSAQRVYIQCIEDANITVLLIDQGRHAVISKQDLYKLPDSLTDIHPLAVQIYLPVKVAPGRESGAVIAVAEVAHQSKCVCLDLDDKYTLIWCPGVGDLGDFLVDNKLATPMHWNVGWKYRYITSVKRRLEEEAFLLTSDARQEDSFYQTADTDLAAKLEQSLKTLNVNSA